MMTEKYVIIKRDYEVFEVWKRTASYFGDLVATCTSLHRALLMVDAMQPQEPEEEIADSEQQSNTKEEENHMSDINIPDTATGIRLGVTDWVDADGNPADNLPTSGSWSANDNGAIVSHIEAIDDGGDVGNVSAAHATLIPGEKGEVMFTFTGVDEDGTVATASVTVAIIGSDAVEGTATAVEDDPTVHDVTDAGDSGIVTPVPEPVADAPEPTSTPETVAEEAPAEAPVEADVPADVPADVAPEVTATDSADVIADPAATTDPATDPAA